MDERLSDFPPKEESETQKTTRVGSMMVTGVYLGALGLITAIGVGASWSDLVKSVKNFFNKGRGI